MEKKLFESKGREMTFDRDAFALELKTYRLRQGLTQRQLGDKWGLSRYTIMRAELAKNLTWESAYRLFARLCQELKEEDS